MDATLLSKIPESIMKAHDPDDDPFAGLAADHSSNQLPSPMEYGSGISFLIQQLDDQQQQQQPPHHSKESSVPSAGDDNEEEEEKKEDHVANESPLDDNVKEEDSS
jgi:hypothetical protein